MEKHMCKMVRLKTNQNKYIMIAEHKKDCIANIIDAAEQCNHIFQIYLFGSALEERCNDDSDIDIAVVSDIPKSKLYQLKSYDSFARDVYLKQIGQAYDILVFFKNDEIIHGKSPIGEQIKENGKIIYQRKTA